MANTAKSSLDKLKEITNLHRAGIKRKDAEESNPKGAKGGPGQTFGGEAFTEA